MLRIAVQSKGRLFEETMALLQEADIKISTSKRILLEVEILISASCNNAIVSSNKRPFDCTAILSMILSVFNY